MIRGLLGTRGRRADTAAAADKAAPNLGSRSILIIDDHPGNLRSMCLALAGEKYRVDTAGTAAAALRKIGARPPDLILLDSRVPAADGLQLARHLLAKEELAGIPMIALTEKRPGPLADCAPGRYDGQIQKPIEADQLAGQIRGFLESPPQPGPRSAEDLDIPEMMDGDRRKYAAALLDAIDRGLPDSQFVPAARAGLRELAGAGRGLRHSELSGYLERAERLSNASTVRARSCFRSIIGICRELLEREPDAAPGMADLRIAYLEHRRAELNGLEHALNRSDFDAIRKAGHNLKGTGAAYGFTEITEIGRSLEEAAKAGDAAAIGNLLDQIDAYISIIRPSPDTGEVHAAEY